MSLKKASCDLLNPVEFLSHLRSLNIKIWADGDRLRYSAPPGALTPNLRDQLVAHKVEILTFIQQAEAATVSAIPTVSYLTRWVGPVFLPASAGSWL